MSITAEHSLGFLYLTEDDVQVYVSYDIDGLRGLIVEEDPAQVILHVDPTGNNHMLVMGKQLLALPTDKEKIKAGVDLLRRYGKIERTRNPVLAMMNVDHLVGHLFDEINTPKPNQE